MIWALGVGYVISGMYFGWNLGLPVGGTYGLLAATAAVTVLYVCFVLTYAELTSALPNAGGVFVYSTRAFGPLVGLVAGVAQWIEFVFAPPAIAAAIGAYFQIFLPKVPASVFAVVAYVVFTLVNAWGVALSAGVELLLTVAAVLELLVFLCVTVPHVSWTAFTADAFPHGWSGAFAAIPFAVWFYLGIEGIANVAEEAKRPERDLSRGFGLAMATLVFLAFAVLAASVGVAGWRHVVYVPGKDEPSDSPLPLALGKVVGQEHPLYHMLVTVGLFGLVASFHGIILAAGRVTMEFGRIGYAPAILGRVHVTRKTPIPALIVNLLFGLVAIATGKTGDIITLSVMGALTLYLLVALSQIALRRSEPDLPRPFVAPFHPLLPALAAGLSLVALVSLAIENRGIFLLYALATALAVLAFRFFGPKK
jgi:ethanolamine permease